MSYLPHTDRERSEMLNAIGVEHVDDLFSNVPDDLRSGPLDIPTALSEMETMRLLRSMAELDSDLEHRPSFLGAGAYHHFIPAVVPAITGRSEFYTSYTPYQPEVSQGTLQVIYEYQTMMAELTGLDVSNASLYDIATAAAEASIIAVNETGRDTIAVTGGVHPEYREVLETYTTGQGFQLRQIDEAWVCDPAAISDALDETCAALIVQSPNFFGAIEPMADLARAAHKNGALFIAAVNPLSLAVLSPPGAYDADVAVGCGQPLGIALQYGGPYLGIITARKELLRRLPGRIAGATTDGQARRGYVLTLQAREQHIRRERATSNICTNHALMALAAAVYLSTMGRDGLRQVATLGLQKAHYAGRLIENLPGFELSHDAPYFNELAVQTPVPAAEVNRFLLSRDIIGGYDLGRLDPSLEYHLVLAFTEVNTREEIDDLVATLAQLEPVRGSSPDETALQGVGRGGGS